MPRGAKTCNNPLAIRITVVLIQYTVKKSKHQMAGTTIIKRILFLCCMACLAKILYIATYYYMFGGQKGHTIPKVKTKSTSRKVYPCNLLAADLGRLGNTIFQYSTTILAAKANPKLKPCLGVRCTYIFWISSK